MLENQATLFNKILASKGYTIFCAESITAGLLSSTIASVPGASSVLKGSIVTYQAEIKTQLLGVDAAIIKKYTAESKETTLAMARGLRTKGLGADIYVTVTGVASEPTTDYQIDKEVGQIYVAIIFKGIEYNYQTIFKNMERNPIREQTVLYIFDKILALV